MCRMGSVRVYRHRPWLVLLTLVALALAAVVVKVVTMTVAEPGIQQVSRAVLVTAPLLVAAALCLLAYRIRTVIDDDGVTQHWVTRSFHVRFADITGVEVDHVYTRWFVRLYRGDETFEVIPCHTVLLHALSEVIGPPRALVYARADIDRRLALAEAGE